MASYSRNYVELMEVLLQPRVVSLPAEIQAIYMQNILKIFAQAVRATFNPVALPNEDDDEDHDDNIFRYFHCMRCLVCSALLTTGFESFNRLDPETLELLINTMLARLPIFKQSIHLEVQERVPYALPIFNNG